MKISNNRNCNKLVKLKDLANITIGQGRYNIYHDAGRRVQIITANVKWCTTELGIDEIKRIINKENIIIIFILILQVQQ